MRATKLVVGGASSHLRGEIIGASGHEETRDRYRGQQCGAVEINAALVEFLILKARALDAKVPPVEPKSGSNATDDGERGVIEDYPSDQTETELRDAIEGLSDEAAIDLVAMFWIGRGDFSRDEFAEARVLAAERAGRPVADYLLGEPALGDFLEAGLAALGYVSEDYWPEA